MKTWTRRSIRAVDLGVASQAGAAHRLRFWIRPGAGVLTCLQSARMVVRSVTLLTQCGYRRDQQRILIRSVR